MKSKLIMDTPNSCVTCRLLSFDYDNNDSIPYCSACSRKMVDEDIGDNRPKWCPLELMKDE